MSTVAKGVQSKAKIARKDEARPEKRLDELGVEKEAIETKTKAIEEEKKSIQKAKKSIQKEKKSIQKEKKSIHKEKKSIQEKIKDVEEEIRDIKVAIAQETDPSEKASMNSRLGKLDDKEAGLVKEIIGLDSLLVKLGDEKTELLRRETELDKTRVIGIAAHPEPKSSLFAQFWKGLRRAKLSDDSRFLELSQGFFGAKPGIGKVMYVRECYVELANILLKNSPDSIVIAGNSGIGKSMFSFYLMYRLYKSYEKATKILWQPPNADFFCYFESNAVYCGSSMELFPLYKNASKPVWNFVDARIPNLDPTMKTLLFCSPRRNYDREINKDTRVQTWYMDIWTREELKCCYDKIYQHIIGEETFEQGMQYFGLIPREVFRVSKRSPKERFDKAFASIRPKELFITLEPHGGHHTSSKLMHLRADANFEMTEYKFSCKAAEKFVLDKYFLAIPSLQRDLLVAFSMSPEMVTVYGHLFEAVAHRILAAGGQFPVRPLCKDGLERQDRFERRQLCEFPHLGAITDATDAKKLYWFPKSSKLAAADAIVQPNVVLQMTVSLTHPINALGLRSLMDKVEGFKSQSRIKYYFVVPPAKYHGFQLQVFELGKLAKALRQNDPAIDQYVLSLDAEKILVSPGYEPPPVIELKDAMVAPTVRTAESADVESAGVESTNVVDGEKPVTAPKAKPEASGSSRKRPSKRKRTR